MTRDTSHLFNWLASLDGPPLQLERNVENEADNPWLLFELGNNARLDSLQDSWNSHKKGGLQGSHIICQLLHISLLQEQDLGIVSQTLSMALFDFVGTDCCEADALPH